MPVALGAPFRLKVGRSSLDESWDLISDHDRISVVRIGPKGVVALAAVLITAAMGSGCGASSPAGGAHQEPAKLFLAGDGEMWVVDVADEEARRRSAVSLPAIPRIASPCVAIASSSGATTR
jgi:hypothetical protein